MSSDSSRICPACCAVHSLTADVCPQCAFPLAWISGFPALDEALRNHSPSANCRSHPDFAPELSDLSSRVISLNQHVLTVLGREGGDSIVSLLDPSIELRHCLIAPWKAPEHQDRSDTTQRFFLVDRQSKIGTFVNRQRIHAVELHAGDFIQIGPFAWSFSAEDGHLVPLPPIDGVGISLDGVHIKERLGPNLNLRIEPRTFVAVVGDSGAGKSTLIKVLAGLNGTWTEGNVTMLEANGIPWIRESNPRRFRALLGYVSQDSVLHEELNSEQLLRTSAQLRRGLSNDADLNRAVDDDLLRFDLEHRRTLPIGELSGGENKRLRVANELMGEPRLLILDEPDSGLDRRRRKQLTQLLRARSWQGCTVVLVTHDITDLDDQCDRIIQLGSGRIVCDKTLNPTKPPPHGNSSEHVPAS